jgi:hypothetical protein
MDRAVGVLLAGEHLAGRQQVRPAREVGDLDGIDRSQRRRTLTVVLDLACSRPSLGDLREHPRIEVGDGTRDRCCGVGTAALDAIPPTSAAAACAAAACCCASSTCEESSRTRVCPASTCAPSSMSRATITPDTAAATSWRTAASTRAGAVTVSVTSPDGDPLDGDLGEVVAEAAADEQECGPRATRRAAAGGNTRGRPFPLRARGAAIDTAR